MHPPLNHRKGTNISFNIFIIFMINKYCTVQYSTALYGSYQSLLFRPPLIYSCQGTVYKKYFDCSVGSYNIKL
jgi:hypothetical protein